MPVAGTRKTNTAVYDLNTNLQTELGTNSPYSERCDGEFVTIVMEVLTRSRRQAFISEEEYVL